MRTRRGYIVWIDPDTICNLFRGYVIPYCLAVPTLTSGRCLQTGAKVDIPADAEVSDVHYDWHRRSFGLLLYHRTFPETPDGAEFPGLALTPVTVQAVQTRQDSEDGPVLVDLPAVAGPDIWQTDRGPVDRNDPANAGRFWPPVGAST